MSDPTPRLRPYRPGDDTALMRVCLETGAAGEDATALLQDGELISQVYLLPYLALEPGLATVVASDDEPPEGYVIGAVDSRAFEAAAEERFWPPLRERYPLAAFGSQTLDALLVHLIHHPSPAPDALVEAYPSHLHIDLLPGAQGAGFGRALLERLFGQLADQGSHGVHLGVSASNTRALAFYDHMGFERWDGHGTGEVTMVRRLD